MCARVECGNPETILPLQGKVWLEAHTQIHPYIHADRKGDRKWEKREDGRDTTGGLEDHDSTFHRFDSNFAHGKNIFMQILVHEDQ